MSIKDYEGGIITKNPTTPTGPYQDGVASGVWTIDQAAEYTKQGVWPTAGNVPPYVDDVFSTYLYTGNSSTQTITNGIDLSGEGGLVWRQGRSAGTGGSLIDTERGIASSLKTNTTASASTGTNWITSFNSDGFTMNSASFNGGATYASWTFRKAEKFFDVVTWTGTGSGPRVINHNLGANIGFLLIKCTSNADNWYAHHASVNFPLGYGFLDTTDSWNTTGSYVSAADDTSFTLSGVGNNVSGRTYVAYLFAHDAGGFGDDGSESIIKCGSYTTDANEDATINLGWEPQWLLVKRTDSSTAGDWRVIDSMRGWEAGGDAAYVEANTSDAEAQTGDGRYYLTSTGFKQDNFGANRDYIYIAIRRPMKTPTAGTEVFAVDTRASSGGTLAEFISGFPVDMYLRHLVSSSFEHRAHTRLLGQTKLITNTTAAEVSDTTVSFASNVGAGPSGESANSSVLAHMFRRATGFFDVVAYTGNGVAGHVINHNLGVAPEWIICKKRSSGGSFNDWYTVTSVYYNTNPYDRQSALNGTNGFTGGGFVSSADSTSFTISNAYIANENTYDHIAYLFASVAGVSKIGTYTGTGSDVSVDCGFSSGARFVYIQRADATGDGKYVWDSERGIVAGNDPYLLLNSTDAEVTNTDYIDPLNAGFTVTSSAPAGLNTSGGTYFFLAIA